MAVIKQLRQNLQNQNKQAIPVWCGGKPKEKPEKENRGSDEKEMVVAEEDLTAKKDKE
ncbi:MAG: hypothetical protein M1155_00725 [Patescibacteria group bacterium]|nr:hypothetical protein [Patescibacteria group bacterium]